MKKTRFFPSSRKKGAVGFQLNTSLGMYVGDTHKQLNPIFKQLHYKAAYGRETTVDD